MLPDVENRLYNDEHVHRFPAEAINCFTGSLAKLMSLRGTPIQEANLLEYGDGYLFRCGLDECGYPEYTFSVQEVGLLGCLRLGASVETASISDRDWIKHLSRLARTNHGAVVWVNTSHLTYDDFYLDKPAYLHALLVTYVSEDEKRIQIYDPLVVNRRRYGCQTWVAAEKFHEALSDKVTTETYNHMGLAHSIDKSIQMQPSEGALTTLEALARQSELYHSEAKHHEALGTYAAACIAMLNGHNRRSCTAARRLFDHISVLYVLPSLALLGQSLSQTDVNQDALKQLGWLVDHWRALALMSLKFEATGSESVLLRISERFKVIIQTDRAMWSSIHRATHNVNFGIRHELTNRATGPIK
ncbi:hypothetical protein SAMN03159444_01908 [Pseudomonas sp. NFACC02]|uniref:hypothetical protein n=1 Tax=Pseudomonas sp. NFACC02 TaxID=1566250 RepID=UPI0008C89406|nr:hypothetical protein [Pseudomonas sp. NFACC02]SEQ54562.1 hypothetical protein SAMN03159444_01908 [Pseudomonas sp. NFACC02]